MRPTGLYAGLTSQITKKFNKSLPFKFLWCPINKYVHIKIMAYLYLCAYLEFFRDGVESKSTRNLALSWEIIWRIIPLPNKNPNCSYLIFSSNWMIFFISKNLRNPRGENRLDRPIPNFFYSSLIMMTADDEKYVGNVIWFHCYFNRGWFWIIKGWIISLSIKENSNIFSKLFRLNFSV